MLKNAPFFAGYGVDDLDAARTFYADTLGLDTVEVGPMLLSLRAGNGYAVLVYQRPNHVPAEFTVLNFPVDDIEATVERMRAAGVEFEHYEDGPTKTDEKGIAHPGPHQAWFKDPAGNILSVISE